MTVNNAAQNMPKNMFGEICIGILTYNRPDYLKRLFDSEAFQASIKKHQAHVFVMAHAANAETRKYLAELKRDAKFTLSTWVSWQDLDLVTTRVRLCDQIIGAGLEPNDVLLFIDDDALVTDAAWIDNYLAPFDDALVGIVGQEAFDVNVGWEFFHPPAIVPGEADVTSSSVMAMRGAVLLGGCEFDLIFGPVWHEDSDFCLQARNAGWKVWGLDRKTTGVVHESYRRTMDVIFQRNLEFLSGKWAG